MKKKILIICIFLVIGMSVLLIISSSDNKKQDKNKKRYDEIKNDINKELERYMYVIAPNCQPNNGIRLITHQDLVYNAGMDKEKFLDIDNKSYCKAYIKPKCVEVGKWEWDIKISCNDYEDKGYVNWAKPFEPKK